MGQTKVEEDESAVAAPQVHHPREIILKVYMHCEGCARKLRCCLRGFKGVEDVMTDCKSNKLVVKGDKADPLKVLERVQMKSHRQVELLSPIPKPPSTAEEKEKPEGGEKKEEVMAVVVVLKVHMHCEACAQEIEKRIQRMKGVESVDPDPKSSEMTVKGVFNPTKLVDYVYKRTGKHSLIVKQEPHRKNEEEKPKDGGNDKDMKGGGGDGDGGEATAATAAVELKRNELYYYAPRYATEFYAYPPQMFSDESPNACSVM
ncbi:palmitoyl-acyl carrier protein thioesterase [Hibiscus syriacus]|uniref:Palmitoyl-acyl carrier protein thioesterase n=2 Tax=Hibiscus syriacus TaxID=106335 RepID=A0A6A2WRN5_HIBSY|nr:palmitoyl-acyl carrier protein thioesterase [Hibiscus syriacus]